VQIKRRRADGMHTYDTILRVAADVASAEGLDGLTIGSLAERLGLSKSGLFTHFGSKQDLQLATIDAARQRYIASVLEPALKAPRGIARLRALCDRVLDYMAKPEFPGGCFFCVTAAEFHARPGVVRDAILENKNYKRELLASLAAQAQELSQLSAEVDLAQLAFELEVVLDAPTWSITTDDEKPALERSRRAVENILERVGAQSVPRRSKSSSRKTAPPRPKH
jgi:AcrR family transcriptional regulator